MTSKRTKAEPTGRKESKAYLRELYDRVAQDWARDKPKTHGDLIGLPILLEYAKRFGSGGNVIDIGCGDGFVCRLLATFAKHVIGVDDSPAMLEMARRHSGQFKNVDYVLGDMLDLVKLGGLEARFDLCVGVNSVCCVQSEAELTNVYRQVHDVLRPGGRAVMQIPHPLDGQLTKPSAWLEDLDGLSSYFNSGQLVRRRLRLLDERWVTVARYHFPLSTHVNAGLTAGLILDGCAEPRPSIEDISIHSDLERDAQMPSVWTTFWRKP